MVDYWSDQWWTTGWHRWRIATAADTHTAATNGGTIGGLLAPKWGARRAGHLFSAGRAAPPLPPAFLLAAGRAGCRALPAWGGVPGQVGVGGGTPAALLVAGLAGAALVPALPCGVTPADC